MVVNAKHVGAIIGQGGNKIREITGETNARCVVDSFKSAVDAGNNEKVIAIQGHLDNCVHACSKILDVVNRELEKETGKPPSFEPRFRIPNTLVGRLIGKNGASVKRLMDETSSAISIRHYYTWNV
ncbi:KH domain-containing protein [Aphelenchoides avenae]|nr:KH domain-containing protein [Aphelenchus avenae]